MCPFSHFIPLLMNLTLGAVDTKLLHHFQGKSRSDDMPLWELLESPWENHTKVK